MARAGRKRKPGKRYPSGDLIRKVHNDRGTPELALQRAKGCGMLSRSATAMWVGGMADKAAELVANDCTDGMDPVGRAWVAGLLEVEGKAPEVLLKVGRNLHLLYWDYWIHLESDGGVYSDERDEQVNAALNRRMETIDREGPDVRKAIYSLCIDIHLHNGPDWLDRLIEARRVFRAVEAKGPARKWPRDAVFETNDWLMMQLALRGLAALA